MSAIRIVPVLLILGGLVLFALQNMSPALPLVILGTATQPLPLALWIGGAIASGAATTLLISALSGLGRPARRAPSRPAATQFSRNSGSASRNPFAQGGNASSKTGSASGSTSGATQLQDDWETRGQKEEWDDWEEPQTRSAPSNFASPSASPSVSPSGSSNDPGFRNPQPEIRDRTDDDWRNWDGYEDSRRDDRRDADPEPRPRRTDFEVKRDPATRHQSGSIYSYGYNQPKNPDFEDTDSRREVPERPGVYDAEYRVITPPYNPPEVASVPQDDWQAVEEELADEPFGSKPDGDDNNPRDRRI